MIDFGWTQIFVCLVALLLALILLWTKNKNLSYIFLCAIFGVYLIGVISVVVFPFPIGYSNPDFKPAVNMIPFNFGSCFNMFPEICFRTIYENILLTVPLGFGISFITPIKRKNILTLGIMVGLLFELTQLAISLAVRSPFRAVDVNDVIFNAIGVWLGYGIFLIFGWVYKLLIQKIKLQPKYIFAYVYDVVTDHNNFLASS
jgi:glycopeptide antibiotics resistance protein